MLVTVGNIDTNCSNHEFAQKVFSFVHFPFSIMLLLLKLLSLIISFEKNSPTEGIGLKLKEVVSAFSHYSLASILSGSTKHKWFRTLSNCEVLKWADSCRGHLEIDTSFPPLQNNKQAKSPRHSEFLHFQPLSRSDVGNQCYNKRYDSKSLSVVGIYSPQRFSWRKI